MFVFGVSITKPEVYERCALQGIRRTAEGNSVVYAEPAVGSVSRSYNHLLDKAAEHDELEALVLVHQDTEIFEERLIEKTGGALADPDVGAIGCVGAIGVRSIAWWEGSVTLASFVNRYEEHGGGDLPAFSWDWSEAPPYARIGEVDTLDGFLLVLSPWTVRNMRFDEELSDFHGYDLDFCLQLREAGKKVLTADLRAIHHRPLEMVPDHDEWVEAHIAVAEKWDGRMPGIGAGPGSWKERARRAEAEAEAAKTIAYSSTMERDARMLRIQRTLQETRQSISWRLGTPIRRFERNGGSG